MNPNLEDFQSWMPTAETGLVATAVRNEAAAQQLDIRTWSPTDSAQPPAPAALVPPTQSAIIEAISSVYDPEIPVDIYALGLIYGIDVVEQDVHITMTLTTPNCPVAGSLPQEVADVVVACQHVENVSVTLTFDPPWTVESMSDDARLVLGY